MAENVRRRNRFLAQNVNTGGQRFQRGCSVFSGRHGGRIAAGYGFDRNHRIGDWFSGKCVRFDDFQIREFLILRCDSVLLVSIGDIHIDTVGRRVQREALRSLSLHEGPQSLGNIVYLDDSPIGRHIAANDLTVPIDVIDGAIQAPVCSCLHLLKGDVAIPSDRGIVRVTRLWVIIGNYFSCRMISRKCLSAGDAGGCQDRPFGAVILHNGGLDTLFSVFLYLCLQFRILVGFLTQEPVVIPHILVVGILIGEAAGIDVAGRVTARGLVALVVPDISLQRHEQTAGDLAGVVRNIGHHPLDVLLRDRIHLTKASLGDHFTPERISVCAGGRAVGIRLEEGLRSITIGITKVHTIELSACCGRRPVAVCLAGCGQAGRPEVWVRHRRDPNAGGLCCKSRCWEQ